MSVAARLERKARPASRGISPVHHQIEFLQLRQGPAQERHRKEHCQSAEANQREHFAMAKKTVARIGLDTQDRGDQKNRRP